MKRKPRILTSRTIHHKEWVTNTTSIFEFNSFSKINKWPTIIKKPLIKTRKYLNKYDVIVGMRLFTNRIKYDVIISASGNQALAFSLLSLIFRKRKRFHILEEIYLQEPIKLKNKIRSFIYKLFLKDLNYIRVSSSPEIENYSKLLNIDKNRFWFLPYPSPVINPAIVNSEESYILSAGKQYRDYSTLMKAIKGTGFRLVVVSDRNSMKSVETSDEVTVLYNISKEKYLDLLSKSKFVVVPLSNDFCSCGQIALLEAMSYGKPVIATKVVGTVDYITDGKSGLFYEKGNSEDLRNKIISLNGNMKLREKIAREALAAIRTKFNQDVFVTEHFKLINEKWDKTTDLESV